MTHAVVIVGAGPAGAAAALRIAARRPDLAPRTLVLDRSAFPRDKLCAGGLSPLAESQLRRLRAEPRVATCPAVAIEFAVADRRERVRTASGVALRTARRAELDAALLDLVRRRGVTVDEGERVRAVDVGGEGVSVVTDRGEHQTLAVIGADGANSVVRRAIGAGAGERGFALETLLPEDPRRDGAHSERIATFDFAPIEAGLGGYCWIFPARRANSPLLNCGIAVCAPDGARAGQQARAFLVEWLAARGLQCEPSSIRGHGLIAYDPGARLGDLRVCLAGDAAGIDPFLAEGIPCALGTGITAADAVIAASDRNDFDLTLHHERVRRSSIGRIMESRRRKAQAWYGRGSVERYFRTVKLRELAREGEDE